jgi:thymidylate synthase
MIVSGFGTHLYFQTIQKSFDGTVANNKAAPLPCHAFFQFYVANGKLFQGY